MRLFIEASIPPDALDAVWAVGEQLRRNPAMPSQRVRWVKREALHLTLRFLGELPDDRVADVAAAVSELGGHEALELQASAIGSFGGRRPRVIWIGLEHDVGYQRLLALRSDLDAALEHVGFEPEAGDFRPHLTLGRVRRQASRSERAAIRDGVESAPPIALTLPVEQVALVHSTLTPDGPRYRRIAQITLTFGV